MIRFTKPAKGFYSSAVRSICVAVLSCVVLAGPARSEGFRNPPDGGEALGRMGARTAFMDDAFAVKNNPANLVAVEDTSIGVGVTIPKSETEFSSPMGSGKTLDGETAIPSVFAATRLSDELVFGVGIFSPFGQSTKWSKTGPFAVTAPYFAEMVTVNANPAVAYAVNNKLSVAAGLSVMYSSLDLRQQLPAPVPPGVPLPTVRGEGDGYGVGGNLAVTWKPVDKHVLAATWRSGMDVDYEGDTTATGLPRSDFDTEIDFPQQVILGYGIELSDNLRVGMDVEWIEFSSFDTLPLDFGANSAVLMFPPAIPQGWEDVWNVGLGADLQLTPEWVLRGGWIYLESPIPEALQAPTLPDNDRHVFSVGLGYEKDQHSVDVAVGISMFDRTVSGNVNPAYNGEYDTDAYLFSLSYSCNY